MALFNEDEEAVTLPDPIPVIAAPSYQSHVIDTDYTDLQTVIIAMEGQPWTVDYFSAVLGADNELLGYSPNRDPSLEQFRKINHFELKVESPLSQSQDDVTKALSVTGAALVYPVLIPNMGDLFIADIGDGKAGIFLVTASERLSHFKKAVHRISYKLHDYVTAANRFALDAKVVKALHFRREFLDYGQSPLIEDEAIAWVRNLELSYAQLLPEYFAGQFSNEYRVLLVPGQAKPLYDPYLNRAMAAFYEARSFAHFNQLRLLNVDEDEVLRANTVWDVVLKRDKALLARAVREIGIVSAKAFNRAALLGTIHHSGVSNVVYPTDGTILVDYQLVNRTKPAVSEVLTNLSFRPETLGAVPMQTTLRGFPYENVPLIHPVMKDSFYIFSAAFYDETLSACSALELQVLDYLDGKAPNSGILSELIASLPTWGTLERCYYLPFVLLLIYANLRSL